MGPCVAGLEFRWSLLACCWPRALELVAGLLFVTVILVLLAGFPVAFTLGGTALIFAAVGVLTGTFNEALLSGLPNRMFGLMTNQTLIAVPLFVFMGVTLERARIAEELLQGHGHPCFACRISGHIHIGRDSADFRCCRGLDGHV